jgi:hypothetical protein
MGQLRDLLIEASSMAGVPISDKNFINWYNSVASKLAMTYDTVKRRATQTITCTDENTEYALTSGCIGIERILDSDGYNFIHYTVRANTKALFAVKGTYTLYLMFLPTAITNVDTEVGNVNGEITIPYAFMETLKQYIIGMALNAEYRKTKDKALKEDSAEAMAMFTLEAQAANNAVRGSNNKYRQVAVGRFR